MRLLERLSSDLQFHGTLAMIRIIRAMPERAAIALGRSIMTLVWAFMPLRRKIANIQISAALSLANPWRLVLKVFMNQGEILVDAIKYAYLSDAEINTRVVVEGKEHLDEALASKRGIMIFTGHIGNWEILSNAPRLLGIQLCHMADLRKDPRLESIIHEMRSRSGVTFLPPKGKALMLIRELKKGRIISMVVDQRCKRKGALLCSFFGLPAITNPGPAFIALKGNALVLPVYTVKQDGNHRICFEKPVDPRDFGQGDDAIQGLSDFMQSFVESAVKRYPDQWFWLHSRWISRSTFQKKIGCVKDFRGFVLSLAGTIQKPSEGAGMRHIPDRTETQT
jgi:Kdo2-lipid IVA lauroyltransferase/acyltransferase